MKKIALIGMMGSGKTTFAKIISEKMNLKYYCTDEYIEEKQGRSIGQIFEIEGEEFFRQLEAEAIKELVTLGDMVLSTGGGIVLNHENIMNLKKNGFIIVLLNRSIGKILSSIDVTKRPLLKEDIMKIEKIYREREFLYKQSSDIIINNNDDIDETLNTLLNVLIDTGE
ncbi:MAG: Shikimate kinase [Clostridiales bacterium 38_11]|nr:MAG: Shikimate kinase [Clostridiales bacterium 38_11]HBH12389.1 shikimate kinase [Clostridiales bacterium]